MTTNTIQLAPAAVTAQVKLETATPAKAQWITPFDLNMSVSKGLFSKEATSEYTVLAAAQKVSYVAASFFVAIAEVLQNIAYGIANVGIWTANSVHSLFDTEVEALVVETPKPPVADPVKDPMGVPNARSNVRIAYDFCTAKAKQIGNATLGFVTGHKAAVSTGTVATPAAAFGTAAALTAYNAANVAAATAAATAAAGATAETIAAAATAASFGLALPVAAGLAVGAGAALLADQIASRYVAVKA